MNNSLPLNAESELENVMPPKTTPSLVLIGNPSRPQKEGERSFRVVLTYKPDSRLHSKAITESHNHEQFTGSKQRSTR
jgi:hypothetical protein